MGSQLYEIFLSCFPSTTITMEEFEKRLNLNESIIIQYFNEDKSELLGFSVVRENCIYLMCVKPECQKQGIGTKLLLESEKIIKENGFNEVLLGHKFDKTSLFKGVPLFGNDNFSFFSKHNYEDDYTSFDMNIVLNKEETGNSEYSIIDTSKTPELKNSGFESVEGIDPVFYDKYFQDDDKECLFIFKNEILVGACAYKKIVDKKIMEIYDLVSYPSFNLNSKRELLLKLQQIKEDNEISEVVLKSINNPVAYELEYDATVKQKYWRGSKSC